MQAIKEKIEDMKEMHKVKAEAKAAENDVREEAKARMEVAHQARLATEAEAAKRIHANRAADKAVEAAAKNSG